MLRVANTPPKVPVVPIFEHELALLVAVQEESILKGGSGGGDVHYKVFVLGIKAQSGG